jgi:anti-sigma regulatory factor (Ser/Thr protein kinase)
MDPIGQTVVVPVKDSSQIALARRSARSEAVRVGLPEASADQVEIAAVELATNLLNHAHGGVLLLNAFVQAQVLELLSVDAGPGMADLTICGEDGYSSGTTPGLGLGSIRRLSDAMEAYSWPGKGTVISARFAVEETLVSLPGVVCTAMHGEHVSGDRWACKTAQNSQCYLVVDGLGHGQHASEAASMATEIFLSAKTSDATAMVQQMHGPMRSTRGAALAVVCMDHERHIATYCGVGNISGRLLSETRTTNLVSLNGTVGHQARQIRSYEYPFADGDLLVMHSDGISTHWGLETYPGLRKGPPPAVAAIQHRDFNRGRDDATALAVRA